MLSDWIDRLAVWNGFHPDLQTLTIYGIGIALYTALVFTFYSNISRRDPLHSKERPGWWGKVVHHTETILTFPLLSFGYFAVISLALFLMAKPDRSTTDILLLSMSAVVGVRVTAHVSESMSNDIAKLLPLGLLAVVVVDPGYLTIVDAFRRIGEAAFMLPVLAQYFALFILIEAVLRGVRGLFPSINKLAHKIDHRRHLSKKAMLRDIATEHEGGSLLRRTHHEHGARDRSHDFLTLDENVGGKPGSRQGVGPALKREAKHAHGPRQVKAAHAPAPKAGPGGSGGKLGSW